MQCTLIYSPFLCQLLIDPSPPSYLYLVSNFKKIKSKYSICTKQILLGLGKSSRAFWIHPLSQSKRKVFGRYREKETQKQTEGDPHRDVETKTEKWNDKEQEIIDMQKNTKSNQGRHKHRETQGKIEGDTHRDTERDRESRNTERYGERSMETHTETESETEKHQKTKVDKTQRCREKHKVVNDSEMISMSTLRVSNGCVFGTLIKSVSLMGLFGLQYLR